VLFSINDRPVMTPYNSIAKNRKLIIRLPALARVQDLTMASPIKIRLASRAYERHVPIHIGWPAGSENV